MSGPTTSAELRREVEVRRERAEDARTKAIREVLNTASGRRLWLWIREEVCFAGKRAPGDRDGAWRFEGRRDVGLDMDRALQTFPELRVLLAQDRAAIEADDAAYHVLEHRAREVARQEDDE